MDVIAAAVPQAIALGPTLDEAQVTVARGRSMIGEWLSGKYWSR